MIGGIIIKKINLNQTIYTLVSDYPELKDILASIGFTEIIKPGMISTVGRLMTLKAGSGLRRISIEQLKSALLEHDFQLEGGSDE